MNDKKIDQSIELSPNLRPAENQPSVEVLASKEQEGVAPDENHSHQAENGQPTKKRAPFKPKKVLPQIPQLRDPVAIKIEKILESGLADEYAKLSPISKQEFKIKGEETTLKISELLKQTHVKVKLIFALIVEWLKVLPGINKFFLEQEAKIKTDLVLELHKKDTQNNNKLL